MSRRVNSLNERVERIINPEPESLDESEDEFHDA